MQRSRAASPIGILDSGIGGLTAAHALVKILPNEPIIYFGDTAHMPYGDKSTAAIQAFTIKIVQALLQQNCKLILLACNSASAAAYELVKEYIGTRALVVNVIDPAIQLLKDRFYGKRIGLIGTRQTVHSNIYKRKIDNLDAGINLSSYATNLLASAIEEFGDNDLLDHLLKIYLAHPELQNIDALLLACTHYPIIKNRIATFYQNRISIIDSSEIVAKTIADLLEKNNLLNKDAPDTKHFYVSDLTDSFATNAKLFFGEKITLEHYPIWD